MKTFRIFTIKDLQVSLGAEVDTLITENKEKFPVLAVGENQWLAGIAYFPLSLNKNLSDQWQTEKKLIVHYAYFDQDRLVITERPIYSPHYCLVVFKTSIGQGGANSHRGNFDKNKRRHTPFPGQILKRGKIGHYFLNQLYHGQQLIALMPNQTVFSVHIYGQLQSSQHQYFLFNGRNIETFTK